MSKKKAEILNYGDNRTIHGTTKLDVELDKKGNVVSIWFRCMALPFEARVVGPERAKDMRVMSKGINETCKLHAVKIEIPKD